MIKNFRLFESLGIADNILHLAEDMNYTSAGIFPT
jgi:hypothetical protein